METIGYWIDLIKVTIEKPIGIVALAMLLTSSLVLAVIPGVGTKARIFLVLLMLVGMGALSWRMVLIAPNSESDSIELNWDFETGNCIVSNPKNDVKFPNSEMPGTIFMRGLEIEGVSSKAAIGTAFAQCKFEWKTPVKDVELFLCGGRTFSPDTRGNLLRIAAFENEPKDMESETSLTISGNPILKLGRPGSDVALQRRSFPIQSENPIDHLYIGIQYADAWSDHAVQFRICSLSVRIRDQ